MQNNGKITTDLMLTIVINLGICFYRAGLFDEAYSCFENSDMRIKCKISSNQKNIENIDNYFKYLQGVLKKQK